MRALDRALRWSCSAACCGLARRAVAQELAPRTYSNAPVGLNFLMLSYAFSTGNVLVDSALPIEGLEADLHLAVASYVRTFGLAGVNAKLKATLPVSAANYSGFQTGVGQRQRTIDGLADMRFTLDVNFLGAPALEPKEFASYRQKTILGASFSLFALPGDYDPSKLLNLGSNRWTFRPEVGISHGIGKWTLEAMGTAWFFADNDDFFGGQLLQQDPLYAIQGHLIYNFRRGFWLGFDAGFADGGTTRVDGAAGNTLQRNSRFGAAVQYPLSRRHGLRVSFTSGLTTRLGADFRSIGVSYQYMWGGGL